MRWKPRPLAPCPKTSSRTWESPGRSHNIRGISPKSERWRIQCSDFARRGTGSAWPRSTNSLCGLARPPSSSRVCRTLGDGDVEPAARYRTPPSRQRFAPTPERACYGKTASLGLMTNAAGSIPHRSTGSRATIRAGLNSMSSPDDWGAGSIGSRTCSSARDADPLIVGRQTLAVDPTNVVYRREAGATPPMPPCGRRAL